jgi:hydroxyacylglutathione hydrolase
MTLELVTVPCLSDNYAYLIHDEVSGETALVDAPEAAPIRAALEKTGWKLTHIFLTHHHHDHVGAVEELRAATGAQVVGAKADAHRLPPLDLAVSEGDTLQVGDETGHVLDVSGHTVGHIAFHFPQSALAFTADSLMALGCGRLFEGSAEQMWVSLKKLMALPSDTIICSGHEYTAANAKFALTIDPENPALKSRADAVAQARADGRPTVPSRLSDELATNPFLRASDPGIRAYLGLEAADDAEVFAKIRARKDAF